METTKAHQNHRGMDHVTKDTSILPVVEGTGHRRPQGQGPCPVWGWTHRGCLINGDHPAREEDGALRPKSTPFLLTSASPAPHPLTSEKAQITQCPLGGPSEPTSRNLILPPVTRWAPDRHCCCLPSAPARGCSDKTWIGGSPQDTGRFYRRAPISTEEDLH